VAVHHFSAPTQNQGVPAEAIAKDLIACGLRSLIDAPPPPAATSPFDTRTFGLKPFVARTKFRSTVRELFGNGGRVLSIEGGSRIGKTYSYQLLTYLASQHEHCAELKALAPRGMAAHKINLEEYTGLGDGVRRELINAVVRMLGLSPPNWDTHAQAAREFVNLSSWFPAQLRASGVLHWLFIDNLDRFALDRDGVKTLLADLVSLIEEDFTIPLRLVLVLGEKGAQLRSDLGAWTFNENVTAISREEAESWLRSVLTERGRPADAARIKNKVGEFHPGVPAPGPPVLAVKLAEALDELTRGDA
jgi:hypothetical protein